MPLEYEYRYQDGNFDKNKIRSRLKELGAVKHGHWLFRVQVFTNPFVENNPYIRIRDEGYKITMTYKIKGTDEFVNEQEVDINDFDTGVNIMLGLGCVKKYYYEKLREIWHLDNIEVCWDTNPGRPDLMEVEAKTKKELDSMIKLLNLEDVSHDDFKDFELYEKPFGIILPGGIDLTFQTIKKTIGNLVIKNKDIFDKLVDEQNKMYKLVKNTKKDKANSKKVNKSTKTK